MGKAFEKILISVVTHFLVIAIIAQVSDCQTSTPPSSPTTIDPLACPPFNDLNCSANGVCQAPVDSPIICVCKAGYSGDGFNCADVNECVASATPCGANEYCSNTPGSFICSCNPGYVSNGTICVDVDECANSTPCNRNAVCNNTIGSYFCTCLPGFAGNGTSCTDINECVDMTPCKVNQVCNNSPGSYSCACVAGYMNNGTDCVDINECNSTSSPQCDSNANCTNTMGSYLCTCKNGYMGNGFACNDINECLTNSSNCQPSLGNCTNTIGSFKCSCVAGYVGNGVDVCLANPCVNRTCGTNASCRIRLASGRIVDANAIASLPAGELDSGLFGECFCGNGLSGNASDRCYPRSTGPFTTIPPPETKTLTSQGPTGIKTNSGQVTASYKTITTQASTSRTSTPVTSHQATTSNVTGQQNTTAVTVQSSTSLQSSTTTDTVTTFQTVTPEPNTTAASTPATTQQATTSSINTIQPNTTDAETFTTTTTTSPNTPSQPVVTATSTQTTTRAELPNPCYQRSCVGNATCQVAVFRNGGLTESEFPQDSPTLPGVLNTDEVRSECECNYGFLGDGNIHCTATCQRSLYVNGTLYLFNPTPDGQTGYSTNTCAFTGQPLASATCVVVFRGYYDIRFDQSTFRTIPCRNESVENIAKQADVANLNTTTFEDTVSELDALTFNSSNLNSNDVTATANFINTVANTTNFTVTPFAYQKIVNIADHVTTFLEQPSANQTTSNSMTNNDLVRSLTLLAYRVNLTSGSDVLTVSTPYIEAEVTVQQNPSQSIQFQPSVFQDPSNQTIPIQPVTITIPLEALQEAEGNQQGALAMRRRRQIDMATNTSVRAVFLLHRTSVLFPSNEMANWVVSGNVGNETTPASISNLMDNVNITHNTVTSTAGQAQDDSTLQAQYVNQSCVFWNFTTNDWSTQGCCLVPGSNPATCHCDHLTNFAILVSIYDIPANVPLQTVTLVGCVLSIVALVITVILLLVSKDIRSRRPMQVLINVCVNLSIVYLIFVAGIDQRQHEERCLASAVCLHFFLLSNWCWMAVYGHLLYKSIVKVFDVSWDYYMLKAYFFTYGFPAVVVIINIVVNKVYEVAPDTSPVCGQANAPSLSHTMLASNMCWIEGYSFYIGFLLPVAALLLFNLVMFLLVIVSLTCKRKTLPSTSKNPSNLHNLVIALSIASTLGLVWFFGFFMMLSDNVQYLVAMSWLFTIVASLQGFCVFALTCLRKGDVRRLWWPPVRRLLCCFRGGADTPSAAVSSTANKSESTAKTDLKSNSKSKSELEEISLTIKN